jgi:FKBP-type peptidyl-prolyl cis-trans isomerase
VRIRAGAASGAHQGLCLAGRFATRVAMRFGPSPWSPFSGHDLVLTTRPMLQTPRSALSLLVLVLGCNASKPAEKPEKTTEAAKVEASSQKSADQKAPTMPKDPNAIPAPADVAKAPADAQTTASGLATKVIAPGTAGDHPREWDKVTVHYTGWTTDGNMFDSSETRKEPVTFALNQVIAGWTEGLQLMVPGEKRRLWIPEKLAYQGQPGAPAGTLVFDVQLLSVEKLPDPPKAPADVAAAPADAQKTASGLASKVLKKGSGSDKPAATDIVKVHYSGWTTDGKLFDSSVSRNEPATFPLDRIIKGWSEGLQLMTVGETRRLWIPKELAYNDRPGRPQGTLVFDIELLEILTPKAPADVKAPPKDATTTASGLASKVLKKGTGKEHPSATNVVKVDYSGWTTDGKMFDSSVTRGEPAEFPLNGVIPGWTEGVQLMVEGEKRRFWIPEALAYKGQAGAPAGMLVFDVELLKIVK